MVHVNSLRKMVSNGVHRLRHAFHVQPPVSPLEIARQLLNDGIIDGHEADHPRFQEFLASLNHLPFGRYESAIAALRFLADAGSGAALDHRNGEAAMHMGDHFFHANLYVPSVIEHAVAYAHGYEGVFETLAKEIEVGTVPCDRFGFYQATEYLKQLGRPEPRSERHLADGLQGYGMPLPHLLETLRLWKENPDISQLLSGDLEMYKAAVCSLNGDRKGAWDRYQDAVFAGVSSRIDVDLWRRRMFSTPEGLAGLHAAR